MEEKKDNSLKIVCWIVGGIAVAMAAVMALCVSVYQLARRYRAWDEFQTEYNERLLGIVGEEQEKTASHTEKDQYYEFENAIRDDLSYQVTMEDFVKKADNGREVQGQAAYPVITGADVKNLDAVNHAIQKELGVIGEYVERISKQLAENSSYLFDAECYVTYMDEKTFSVAYVEYGYLNGEQNESYVVSVNIDMESGMVMTNTQLMEIDDDFSIDFRERSKKQNGEIQLLDSYYSDQEITELLNDEDRLIIFYTPLGMEVGINYDYGWVTVTYPDYEEYQNPL